MLSDFLRSEDLCFTIQHEIAPRINITDFEVMHSEGGRPLTGKRQSRLRLRLGDRALGRRRLDQKRSDAATSTPLILSAMYANSAAWSCYTRHFNFLVLAPRTRGKHLPRDYWTDSNIILKTSQFEAFRSSKLKTHSSFKTLTQVFAQNFQDDGSDP